MGVSIYYVEIATNCKVIDQNALHLPKAR